MDAATLAQVLADADCLADEARVAAAVSAVAQRITAELAGEFPVVLCVMRGGVVFAGQVLTQLRFPLEFDYVHATRYGDATTGGALQWRVQPTVSLEGRAVLLLDDILDVGATLDAIADECRARGASVVRTAVLVEKQHDRKARPGLRPDYAALTVPDRYVFGCGMDYRGFWRNAPGIYAVKGL